MNSNRAIVLVIPIFAALLSMGLLGIGLLNNWMGKMVFDFGAVEFCEAFADSIIKQPANTWSNMGFVLVGLLIGWHGMKNHFSASPNKFTRSLFYPTFFATLCVLLGPGSMAMHASAARLGGFFDVLSMYMLATFMATYALERVFNWSRKGFSLLYFSTFIFCMLVHLSPQIRIGMFKSIIIVFALLIFISIAIELYFYHFKHFKINPYYGYACLGTFIVSIFIWYMSRTGNPWCDSKSIIQGHAAWHLLDALAVYLLYRYYVSEDRNYELEK